jgi:hypothetical protein
MGDPGPLVFVSDPFEDPFRCEVCRDSGLSIHFVEKPRGIRVLADPSLILV